VNAGAVRNGDERASDSNRADAAAPVPDGRHALIGYLHDQLVASDSSLRLVEHLEEVHRDTLESALFRSLAQQFREEQHVVEALLVDIVAAPVRPFIPMVRRARTATDSVQPGKDLDLFRGLGLLAAAVQAKRGLWRTAQVLDSPPAAGRRTFAELEAGAVNQWEAIERLRLAIAPRAFAW